MKNFKKISRSQMKNLNGGGLTCSEACCPPPGVKRCPWVYCVAPCDIIS
ncbi:bacteriocin-like protein [Chryseobacterium terrae]|uniref:Bacteriocin-type signal sequence-containing protein n=1 Tax=Chryseobacterium terrae TaxID=3163299 RepID=A0ABW8XWW5_9FLAO